MFGGIELSDDELARHILSASGPFETLLLPGAASLPEAKAAYKQIAKRLHPDKSAHREAAEAFKAAGNALLQLENSHATKDRYATSQASCLDARFFAFRDSSVRLE